MEELITIFKAFETLLSITVFAGLLLVTVISLSRRSVLYGVWEEAVEVGRLQKLSQKDLLQPWLVRIYQRARVYRNFAIILLAISITIFTQLLYRAAPPNSTLSDTIFIFRTVSIFITNVVLFMSVFSVQLGLRAEVRDLRKRFPTYDIRFEDLLSLYESDKYFSPENLPKRNR